MAIRLRDIEKTYRLGKVEVRALKGVCLEIAEGDFVSLTGPSGAGKTTLLHVMGCIEEPSSGEVEIRGKSTRGMRDAELSRLRNGSIGFIFQSFNLISVLNVLENVEYPLAIRGGAPDRSKALSAIESVGLSGFMRHRPDELSGGQRQRVAIARALAADPGIIIADEPTANLDSKTGAMIMDLLVDLNRRNGTTFIVSTHDEELSSRARRHVRILDGELRE